MPEEERPRLGVVEIVLVSGDESGAGIPLVVLRVHGGQGGFQQIALDHRDATSVADQLAKIAEEARVLTDPAKLNASWEDLEKQ